MLDAKQFNSYMRAACDEILVSGNISDGFALRPTQREALESYITFLDSHDLSEEEKLSGFFEIPTGVGKTALFGALIAHARKHAVKDNHDLKICIVAPTINLLAQTKEELETLFPDLKGNIGLFGGDDRQLDKPVIVITYDSWAQLIDRGGLNAESFDLIVSDEAHRGTSASREKRLVDTFNGIGRLAVTATAHFDENKTVYLSHKNNIYEKHISDAVRNGELAAYIQIQFSLIRVLSDNESGSDARLARQIAFNRFVESVLMTGTDQITGDLLTDNQGGIFVQDTNQANELADLLNGNEYLRQLAEARGCKAFGVAIHTNGISPSEQMQRELDYKAGKYLFVIGDEKFKEGFNHPAMKTVIDVPHGSLVDKAQILGRGARRYYNAEKDRLEGLTFIDTILYMGSDDPEVDAQARRRVIANSITATDVLDGEPFVFDPSAPPKVKKRRSAENGDEQDPTIDWVPTNPLPPPGDPSGYVSFIITQEHVRSFLADREKTRIKPSSTRMLITDEMRNALNEAIATRGNYGSWQLMRAVETCEVDQSKESVGLNDAIIENLVKGRAKTAEITHWERLNESLSYLEPRMVLTRDMIETLVQQVEERGGYGAKKLVKAIEGYEAEQDLPSTGIKESTIEGVLTGRLKAIKSTQWERLNDVVGTLFRTRMPLTEPMVAELNREIAKRGQYGQSVLCQRVNAYEAKKGLTSVEFTASLIGNITGGRTFSVDIGQWQRLNEVISSLPEIAARPRLELDDAKVQALKSAIAARGSFGSRKLMGCIRQYEEANQLEDTGLTDPIITSFFSGKLRTVDLVQWERLSATVSSLPIARVVEMINVAPTMVDEITTKAQERGLDGPKKIYEAVASRNTLEGVTARMIERLCSGEKKTIDKFYWLEINAALDQLPLSNQSPRITPSVEDLTRFRGEVEKHARMGARRILGIVNDYEKERRLETIGITTRHIERLLYSDNASLQKDQWERLCTAIDALKVVEGNKLVTLTSGRLEEICTKIAARGDLGASRLQQEVEAYEKTHAQESVGLTKGNLTNVLNKDARTLTEAQLKRLNDVLDALPEKEPPKRIPYTQEMAQTLNERLASIEMGNRRFLTAVESFAEAHGAEPSEMNESSIKILREHRTKTVSESQWTLIEATLDSLEQQSGHQPPPRSRDKNLKSSKRDGLSELNKE